MAPPEKPTRLGRGLDALLARREPPKGADSSGGSTGANHRPAPNSAATRIPEVPEAEGGAQGTPAAPVLTASRGVESNESVDSATLLRSEQPTVARATDSSHTAGDSKRGATAAQTASGSASGPAGVYGAAGAKGDTVDSINTGAQSSSYRLLPIAHIAPNSFQPRKEFHEQDLADLESSLRSQGLLQPITVRPSPGHSGYELIAGERRLRAATRLGWTEIPALIRDTNDRAMLTLAMVENLQRADLDPIEEADGYQRLIDDFSATQQEVAEVVGKERSTVANALRLLALPASVKRMLQERKLTVGHARALLPLETERAMADLARDVIAKTLSVRDVEQRVRGSRPSPAKSGRKAKPANTGTAPGSAAAGAEMRRVEELLRKKMQTTVTLHLTGKERGEVRISFLSNDDLERVLDLLGVNLDS